MATEKIIRPWGFDFVRDPYAFTGLGCFRLRLYLHLGKNRHVVVRSVVPDDKLNSLRVDLCKLHEGAHFDMVSKLEEAFQIDSEMDGYWESSNLLLLLKDVLHSYKE